MNTLNTVHTDITRKAKHLEVICDAHNLPFQNDAFNLVHASHILEHLENPHKALSEMKRVTNRLVIAKVPNATYSRFAPEISSHFFSWNESTLRNFLEKHFRPNAVEIRMSERLLPWSKSIVWRFRRAVLTTFWGSTELTAICRK